MIFSLLDIKFLIKLVGNERLNTNQFLINSTQI